jgi:hypothetical protein
VRFPFAILLCAVFGCASGSASRDERLSAPDSGTSSADAGSVSDGQGVGDASTAQTADAGSGDGGSVEICFSGACMPDGGIPAAVQLGEDEVAVGACSNGWCWQNPRPFGATLDAISTTSPQNAWAVSSICSAAGAFHWDGTRWSVESISPENFVATDIVALNPDDVWAIFAGCDTGAVYPPPASDSLIVHWDGNAWKTVLRTNELRAETIVATSSSDLWVGGHDFAADGVDLRHFDGAGWTNTRIAPSSPEQSDWHLGQLHSNANKELFATGVRLHTVQTGQRVNPWQWWRDAFYLQFNGGTWQEVTIPVPFAGDATGLWFAGFTSWWSVSPQPSGQPVLTGGRALRAIYEAEGFTLGATLHGTAPAAAISAWNGTSWTPVASANQPLLAIGGNGSARDIWAVGANGESVSFDGRVWASHSAGSRVYLTDVFVAGEDDVFAAGENGTILRSINGRFVPMATGTTQWLSSLSGTSPRDVWAAGLGGTLLHFDGSSWAPVDASTSQNLFALCAVAPSNVWMALYPSPSSGYKISRWDGTRLNTVLDNADEITGCWASSADDVWFASLSGGVHHWNGTHLTFMALDLPRLAWAISGSGPSDVWVTDDGGGVEHWDGKQWTLVRRGTGQQIGYGARIAVRSPTDVFVLRFPSGVPAIEHYDGTSWSLLEMPAGLGQVLWDTSLPSYLYPMSTLRTGPGGSLWLAGYGGAILRWNR